jgi:hypothetical protein
MSGERGKRPIDVQVGQQVPLSFEPQEPSLEKQRVRMALDTFYETMENASDRGGPHPREIINAFNILVLSLPPEKSQQYKKSLDKLSSSGNHPAIAELFRSIIEEW